MSFRPDLGAHITRFLMFTVFSDSVTLIPPCGQSYTSLIKRQASRVKSTSNYLLTTMEEFRGCDKQLCWSGRCGNIGLTLDHSALLNEAVTDFLCSDGDAVLITDSDGLGSRGACLFGP